MHTGGFMGANERTPSSITHFLFFKLLFKLFYLITYDNPHPLNLTTLFGSTHFTCLALNMQCAQLI